MELNAQSHEFNTPQDMIASVKLESAVLLNDQICTAEKTFDYFGRHNILKTSLISFKIVLISFLCFIIYQQAQKIFGSLMQDMEDISYGIINRVIDEKMTSIVSNLNKIQFQNQQERV